MVKVTEYSSLNLTEFVRSSHPPDKTPIRVNKNKSFVNLFMAAEFKMLKYFNANYINYNTEARGWDELSISYEKRI